MTRILIALLPLLALVGLALAVLAGRADAQDEERSRFVRFVERQLSTEDRQIRLGRIEGALSSNVRISEITVADRRGVWLTINDARLEWNRLALLRGRLSIDVLEASSIEVSRRPLPAEGDGEPIEEGARFSLDDIPLSIILRELNVPRVVLAEDVVGPAAQLSVDGSIRIADGELDTDLSIERLDRPGTLSIVAAFVEETRVLNVDIVYDEPANGVLANALDIEGRPPLRFEAVGQGPIQNYQANISLAADGEEILGGTVTLDTGLVGFDFSLLIEGNLDLLVPDLYGPFVEGGSRVTVDVSQRADGTYSVTNGRLDSGAAQLAFAAELGSDFVPSTLTVDGSLGRADGTRLALPGDASVDSATLTARLDGPDGGFRFETVLSGLESPGLSAPRASIVASGDVEDLSDPQTRSITFNVSGTAQEVAAASRAVADALGDGLSLEATGAWQAGQPVTVESAQLVTDTVNAAFSGTVGSDVSGNAAVEADDLSAFAALVGRPLRGSIDVSVDGTAGFDGTFDVEVDGEATGLSVGVAAVDGLLRGVTTLSGGVARGDNTLSFQQFRLDGEGIDVAADGTVSPDRAALQAAAQLRDLSEVNGALSGAIAATLTVSGDPSAPAVEARIESETLGIGDERLNDVTATFDGRYQQGTDVAFDLDGQIEANALVNGEGARLSAQLESTTDGRALRNLSANLLGARAVGSLLLRTDNRLDGNLSVEVPELRPLAALALVEASGAIDARLGFSAQGAAQSVDVTAAVRDLVVPGATVEFADVDLAVDDVFGVPAFDGRAELTGVSAGGFDVRSARLTAAQSGEASDITLVAEVGSAELDAAGRLTRLDDGLQVRLQRFELTGDDIAAVLQSPVAVTVSDNAVAIDPAALRVGEGRLSVAGRVADALELSASLTDVPLRIANLVRPDLGLTGTVSGALEASGPRDAPSATFRLNARNVSAEPLRERGIAPINATASGQVDGRTVLLDRLDLSVGEGSVSARGTVGEALDLTARIDALPLALANAARPELALEGTVSGEADISGSLSDPAATFSASIEGASLGATRERGLPAFAARLAGRFEEGTATLDVAQVTVGSGRLTAEGRVGRDLDLSVTIETLPLALANALRPDLGISGTLTGAATVEGSLAEPTASFDIAVEDASAVPLETAGLGSLSARVAGRYRDEAAVIDTAVIRLGGGTISATGTVGQRLEIMAQIDAFPLALADALRPELDVAGSVSGSVTATGPLRNPRLTFDVSAPEVSARPIREAGLPPASFEAVGRGTLSGATLETARLSVGGAAVTASGLIGRRLDLNVQGSDLPVSLANAFAPDLDVTGSLSLTAEIAGDVTAPRATFEASVAGFSAAPLAQAGVGPLEIDAAGRFAGERVVLDRLAANGPGLSLEAAGTVPLTGSGLALNVTANAPLSLANRATAARGTQLSGEVSADVSLSGSLAAPSASGRINIAGFSVRDPQTGVDLSAGTVSVRLAGDRAVLDPVRAVTPDGGSVALSGSIGLRAPYVADLSIATDDFTVTDGRLYSATLDADLTVTGPLTGAPLIAGTIFVDRAEVRVPARLGGTPRLIEVEYVGIPRDVAITLRRARAGPFADRDEEGAGLAGLTLDVTIDAPSRIFVRGRGIDAELGGRVRLSGPISDVAPVGSFDLIRGRLVILGQRIVFTEGNLTFFGDLDPTVRFVAATRGAGVSVFVIVEGEARDPMITVRSEPELPQDEALAQLLFGRSIDDLSPFQLAQLAAAVAELAGGGGGVGLVDQVRGAVGLDDLDIITEPGGGTTVAVGRYISENIYLGVRAGSSSGVTINLDVTENLTVRGEALTDEAAIGIFYEREY